MTLKTKLKVFNWWTETSQQSFKLCCKSRWIIIFLVKDLIIDLHAGITDLQFGEEERIRCELKKIVKNYEKSDRKKLNQTISLIKSWYITKLDKVNSLVILNKANYDSGMLKTLNDGWST